MKRARTPGSTDLCTLLAKNVKPGSRTKYLKKNDNYASLNHVIF